MQKRTTSSKTSSSPSRARNTKTAKKVASVGAGNSKSLPRLAKSELKKEVKFKEGSCAPCRGLSTFWIVVFAFLILAVFSVVVWAVLSGRSDQKIHGDNLKKLEGRSRCEMVKGAEVCTAE